MDLITYVAFAVTFALAELIESFHSYPEHQLQVTPQYVEVEVGSLVQANCTSENMSPAFSLHWEVSGQATGNARFIQKAIDSSTLALVIVEAKPSDSGKYRCMLRRGSRNEILVAVKQLEVHVSLPKVKPCDGGFLCANARCVSQSQRCDYFNDCEDWSDEKGCHLFSKSVSIDATSTIKPGSTDPTADDQMTWLKTTVYTVIACTVGVVLIISIVVIAVFRIKMKRAAIRRSMRAHAERRRRHMQQGSEGHGERTQNPGEVEPFISSPSQSHFGNIIVNVNNGVQYVPNSEITSLVQSPPPYSEVVAENQRPGRHSPPPDYSTIDRNPNRMSSSPSGNLQLVGSSEQSQEVETSVNVASGGSEVVSQSDFQAEVGSEGHHSSASDVGSVVDETADVSNTRSAPSPASGRSSALGCTGGLGQSSHPTPVSDNVSGRSSPWRPKQLQVRDGQIVLDGNSPPETASQVTQTNPADIQHVTQSTNQQAGKPAQIQVQRGQIVLTNQAEASAVEGEATDIDSSGSARGQLEVKNGQIVFKS